MDQFLLVDKSIGAQTSQIIVENVKAFQVPQTTEQFRLQLFNSIVRNSNFLQTLQIKESFFLKFPEKVKPNIESF
jgi:hypothetical protein